MKLKIIKRKELQKKYLEMKNYQVGGYNLTKEIL